MKWTTIMLDPKIKYELEKLKIHPRQSFGEVISKLIDRVSKDGNAIKRNWSCSLIDFTRQKGAEI